MPLSFFDFLAQAGREPALLITALLTLAVLVVNGWTDAPNAIAGSLNTRSPSVGQFVFGGFDPNSKGYESYYVFRNMGTYVSEAGRDDVALTCAGHSNEQ